MLHNMICILKKKYWGVENAQDRLSGSRKLVRKEIGMGLHVKSLTLKPGGSHPVFLVNHL